MKQRTQLCVHINQTSDLSFFIDKKNLLQHTYLSLLLGLHIEFVSSTQHSKVISCCLVAYILLFHSWMFNWRWLNLQVHLFIFNVKFHICKCASIISHNHLLDIIFHHIQHPFYASATVIIQIRRQDLTKGDLITQGIEHGAWFKVPIWSSFNHARCLLDESSRG